MSRWPSGYGLITLAQVDSTLAEARRRLPEISGPTWILAQEQTAGRGRRGRAWVQPAGNFSATLVLPSPGAPDQAALRSFVTALALSDVLLALGLDPALKWPNDVLLERRKLAGILLEGLPGGALAIGIGVNLVAAPGIDQVEPGAVEPIALKPSGVEITAEDFLGRLADAFARREGQFATYGFGPIRDAWLARAVRLGEEITVRLPQETLVGTFKDVDAQGQLVLSTPQGVRRITAGDVFF